MPSVYTIEGASRGGRRKGGRKTKHQKKFAKAAKKCSRLSRSRGIDFRSCMSRELKS